MVDINDTINYLNLEQEEQHTQLRAKNFNLPYVNLVGYPIVKEILSLVPEEKAIQYRIVPYLKVGNDLKIGVVDPKDGEMLQYLEAFRQESKITPVIVLISETSFYYGISRYEEIKKKANEAAAVIENKDKEVEEFLKITDLRSAADAAKKANTTKILEVILLGAIKLKASDIHLEPTETDFLVRYRIDGVLQDVVTLPVVVFKQLVSRIKFMSQLRMDIVNAPQDGRFTFSSSSEKLDFRVSIMPSAGGESIVLRLLGQEKSILKLDTLGFREDALLDIKEAISKPHGMILTSGPTGSGKSSTLYAILMDLKKPGVKIITLEDPVEYKIDGIEQSQIRPGQGYEFADGLRASLRQDPDILMVGEIRDSETAEIAIQAALTGHLVVSTIHANSAPAVFGRLLEIGVRPFLLSGSINLIMAQRLVRKICPDCREEYSPLPETWQIVVDTLMKVKDKLPADIKAILAQPGVKLVRGKGCSKCNSTGFVGRQVIVETLVPNDEVGSLIAKSAAISEFEKSAIASGMITMEQDGLMKALRGTTTIEEVWRVTKS